jgi:predicted RNA-binding protein with PIN domain
VVTKSLSASVHNVLQIIFDAYNTEAVTATRTKVSNTMETIFTAQDQTADQYIERETQDLKRAGCPSVMVVSHCSLYL